MPISFEVFPPKSGPGSDGFGRLLDGLKALAPGHVSVTYGAGGTDRSRTTATLARVRQAGLPAAGHLTCVGQSRAEVDRVARDWHQMGVRRIVALRGDMPGVEGPFRAHPEGYAGAAALVAGLRAIGEFDIAVGCYPEVHPEAASAAADLDHLKRKLAAGASRAVSQFFFSADRFLAWRDRAVAAGITQPLVPGILPIGDPARAFSFARRCGASVPRALEAAFAERQEDADAVRRLAVDHAVDLCRRLHQGGVRDFHFYCLNKLDPTRKVLKALSDGDDGTGLEAAA